jgi:ribosomal protein S3
MFMMKFFFLEQNKFLRFLGILVTLLNSKLFNKVFGLKIVIKGKFNGNERKKKRILKSKNTPLQTIKNVIDYSFKTAITRYGVFGIKIWVFEK